MKKNKVLKIVLIVLGALVALLAAAVLGVLFYLHSMAAGIPETLPDAPADSTQVTLTDDEIDKLLSGEITLEELADEAAASGSGEQEASASAPQQETGAVSSPAGSSASSGSAASRTESSSTASSSKQETAGTANSGTEKPASSSGKQEAGYEAEVKATAAAAVQRQGTRRGRAEQLHCRSKGRVQIAAGVSADTGAQDIHRAGQKRQTVRDAGVLRQGSGEHRQPDARHSDRQRPEHRIGRSGDGLL